jgi:pantetheine-phosphate adenylyltransferase
MSEGRPRSAGGLVALYPGSFDPIHNGHLDVIKRAAHLFDKVIVAIYDTPAKRLEFTTQERVELARTVVAPYPNVEVESYRSLTVEHAAARGAQAIVRGLRATSDFEFELQLALMNRQLNHQIEALFLMTSLEHAHLSSSLIKEIARLGADVTNLVPPQVAAALKHQSEQAS